MYMCLQRPEEGIRSLEAKVTVALCCLKWVFSTTEKSLQPYLGYFIGHSSQQYEGQCLMLSRLVLKPRSPCLHFPSNSPYRHTPCLASYLIWACTCVFVFADVEKCTFLFVHCHSWFLLHFLSWPIAIVHLVYVVCQCVVFDLSNIALGRIGMNISFSKLMNIAADYKYFQIYPSHQAL